MREQETKTRQLCGVAGNTGQEHSVLAEMERMFHESQREHEETKARFLGQSRALRIVWMMILLSDSQIFEEARRWALPAPDAGVEEIPKLCKKRKREEDVTRKETKKHATETPVAERVAVETEKETVDVPAAIDSIPSVAAQRNLNEVPPETLAVEETKSATNDNRQEKEHNEDNEAEENSEKKREKQANEPLSEDKRTDDSIEVL